MHHFEARRTRKKLGIAKKILKLQVFVENVSVKTLWKNEEKIWAKNCMKLSLHNPLPDRYWDVIKDRQSYKVMKPKGQWGMSNLFQKNDPKKFGAKTIRATKKILSAF